MKTGLALVFYLLLLASFASAQSVCRQAKSEALGHNLGCTMYRVWLPSVHGALRAKAAIPDTSEPSGATVFAFSTLETAEGQHSVDMIPLATELTKRGKPTLVIERKLTWPQIDESVGTMQADVICAEQWLSKHANVRQDRWLFVGPESDAPKPEWFDQHGVKSRTEFWAIFPVGDRGDDVNTEYLFSRSTSQLQKWLWNFFGDE